jgi:chaperonin GroES
MAKTKKKTAAPKKTAAKKVTAKSPAKTMKAVKSAKPSKAAKPAAKSSKPAGKVAKSQPAKKIASKPSPKKSSAIKPSKSSLKPATAWQATAPDKSKKSESYFKTYLKPLDDRIVVLVEEMAKMTAGGLYIPETVTDVSGNYHGKVMAIGRGHMNKKGKVKPLDVSVGDKVVFSQFSGSQMDVDGNNVMIIRESDVLGIVK